jgi:hypothetical protein
MRVFLSWSGDFSREVAVVLREWLPSVIQQLEPYVSSEDISKGARWSSDIAKELEVSSFGIICLTKDNLDAPWIHFEAGALSKTVEKSRVSPFLFGVKSSDIPKDSPLLQFQYTQFEKVEVYKLLASLNEACGDTAIDGQRFISICDVWWPQLEDKLNQLHNRDVSLVLDGTAVPPPEDSSYSSKLLPFLEELLELTRNQQKLLRTPESILPPDYLLSVMRHALPVASKFNHRLESQAMHAYEELKLLRAKYDIPEESTLGLIDLTETIIRERSRLRATPNPFIDYPKEIR